MKFPTSVKGGAFAASLAMATMAFAGPPPVCGPDSGDCCEDNGSPGCDDITCCATICTCDPYCCDVEWDGFCASNGVDGACGALLLCSDLCSPPPPPMDCLTPPPDTEGEPCGGDVNGGCNSTPAVFGSVTCGATIVGNAWAEGGARDTDWYQVDTTAECTTISTSLISEFSGVSFIIDGISGCTPVIVGDGGDSTGCEAGAAASADLGPGTYVVFVATADFDFAPCGSANDYTLDVTCTPDCKAESDCCFANGSPGCDDPTCEKAVCGADAFCCDTEWDALCADSAAMLCTVCGGGGKGPVNDDCANALEIEEGDTEYSSVGATNDGPELPAECDEGFGVDFGADIWYSYTPSCDGMLIASTCNQIDYDSRLAAYTGSCTSLVFAACNDDGPDCGLTSILEVPVTCNVPVLLRVGGFGGAQGSGTISLSCTGDVCGCAGDTNGDGLVDVVDLTNVVLLWGSDGQAPGVDADTNNDGVVDVVDMTNVILGWGTCE